MKNKSPYGSLVSEQFRLGDIVEWSVWNCEGEKFVPHYGIITDIKNKIVSNRLCAHCVVMPLDNAAKEIELFALSLKLISKAGEQENVDIS